MVFCWSNFVRLVLKNLGFKKSTGPDGIYFYDRWLEIGTSLLFYLINGWMLEYVVPTGWKSNVTLMHKSGQTDDPGNFVHIPVVPVVAKIYEKMVATHINSLPSYIIADRILSFFTHQYSLCCVSHLQITVVCMTCNTTMYYVIQLI